ncbi:MAG TPA: response regulator, partial [Rhizomicrobium sp.]|nr:response regulator [Rhizomicrobium sp.]
GGDLLVSCARLSLAEHDDPPEGAELHPGDYLAIAVSDTGSGMSPDVAARAFDPFFTTKGIGKGTGLGLPMVHGMAEQVHGRLLLESVPGQGTIAEIWLPTTRNSASVSHPGEEAAPEPSAPRALTVLAVDDDALVLFNTVAMLEDLGHHVLEAMSGEAALALLQGNQVDLVITDQAMPQMTGAQLIDTIRAQWPGLPVILATGYAELPAGMAQGTPKLSKPFAEADLAKVVADVLDVRA